MNKPAKITAIATLAIASVLTFNLPRVFGADAPAPTTQSANIKAALSAEEEKEGFKLIFDGVTSSGWRQLGQPDAKDLPKGWDIQDSSIHHIPRGGGGDITTSETYDNFEIRFDFKIAVNGNNGIKYRVVEVPRNSSALGIEYQIVDANSSSADNKNKHALASLYDLVQGKVNQPKPAGEWNQGKIIVKGNHFEHWLNGEKTAEIDFGTDAWKEAFAASKWARSNPTFAAEPKGHIAIQDHADEVWIRNIRVKVLKPD